MGGCVSSNRGNIKNISFFSLFVLRKLDFSDEQESENFKDTEEWSTLSVSLLSSDRNRANEKKDAERFFLTLENFLLRVEEVNFDDGIEKSRDKKIGRAIKFRSRREN